MNNIIKLLGPDVVFYFNLNEKKGNLYKRNRPLLENINLPFISCESDFKFFISILSRFSFSPGIRRHSKNPDRLVYEFCKKTIEECFEIMPGDFICLGPSMKKDKEDIIEISILRHKGNQYPRRAIWSHEVKDERLAERYDDAEFFEQFARAIGLFLGYSVRRAIFSQEYFTYSFY
ncbi:hypothetical protein C0584_02015 [Candidatus Parcubacteria bacterium]|nr:MAG: hypothetical protein C0584_02015 [Candidatus Parcubacteria bacterium]